MRVPAKNPCGSCPYRKDVPSGVWSEDEYDKLPRFDAPTGEQPPAVFMCHQQDGRICAGWAGCHDMNESLGLRVAVSLDMLTPDEHDAVLDYTTPTPLWGSGAEAAAHGMEEVYEPGERARRTVQKLKRKGVAE